MYPDITKPREEPPSTSGPSPAEERQWLARLADCRERLAAEGVHLETLSSFQVAHDLEYLRRALGAPQLNLVGNSYGGRIAAEAVRQNPAAIRAVYYSSPAVIGRHRTGSARASAAADEALGALFRSCAEDERCHTAYPRLEPDYDSLIAHVRREPLHVQVATSAGSEDVELVVDEQMLREGLASLLDQRAHHRGRAAPHSHPRHARPRGRQGPGRAAAGRHRRRFSLLPRVRTWPSGATMA